MGYEYDKENFKTCPVCQKIIDYHVDSFFHDEFLNIWICRDHRLADILKVIGLRDEKTIRLILSDDISSDISRFQNAYRNACDALLEMSRIWEDELCTDRIQETITGTFPDYLPSFDEFVHDFINIWQR